MISEVPLKKTICNAVRVLRCRAEYIYILENAKGTGGLGAFISEGQGDYSPLSGTAWGDRRSGGRSLPATRDLAGGTGNCSPLELRRGGFNKGRKTGTR
jgi:hypothetical protein